MKQSDVLNKIRKSLQENIDEKTLSNSQNFFKEKIKFYGVKVPMVNKISKDYFENIKNESNTEIFALCENPWKSEYIEESFIACNWSYYIYQEYKPEDLDHFEKWLNLYVNNWASCDTLCNHTIGAFVEIYPDSISRLKQWTKSENRWIKRGAAVSLIIPARKGLFLDDIFEIVDSLLLDKDDLVQKGYGWMLKASSEAHQKKVFDYVMKNKATMPRTSLRYAIEKMPPELRKEAMKK